MEDHYKDYFDVTKSRNTLFIIDPQNDFHPGGSLAIPTANEDSSRISQLIKEHGNEIDDIIVSLDSHQKLHIAHSLFWVNSKTGKHPSPFTPIPLLSVENGEWKTSQPQWQEWGLAYVKQLEANKRFTLLIWPEVTKSSYLSFLSFFCFCFFSVLVSSVCLFFLLFFCLPTLPYPTLPYPTPPSSLILNLLSLSIENTIALFDWY